jgi:uncharacterized protein with von Willebrand factor type A (vWA) domain
LPACADGRRHAFVGQLLHTPVYAALHTATMLRETPSVLAATAFAEQFAQLNKEDHAGTDDMDREMSTLRAVGRALVQATAEVEEANEATTALGMGPGAPGSNDPKAIAQLYRRVRSHPTLRRICALAGRYRRLAQSCQRRKVVHGADDMVGVTLDGDLGRLLPQELAKLAIPDCEDDVLRRLVERQCMSRDYRAYEPVGKGPIIVVADESGSMEGDKIHTAKALALALAWIARHQERWCGLVAFSGESGERLLALPPGRWNEVELLGWLEQFIGHGSSLDVPVNEMPRMYEALRAPRGVTDLIFLTDAQCRLPNDARLRFLAWKQQVQARLITLVIASSPGDLLGISDETHQVASLAVEEAAVTHVLSI